MNSLIDLTLEKLEKILLKFGEPKFRMQQLLYGIYKKGYIHYDEFSNISQKLKIQLYYLIMVHHYKIPANK